MSTHTSVRLASPRAATRSRFVRHSASPRSRPRWVSLSDGTARRRRRAISSSTWRYASAARAASSVVSTFSARWVTAASIASAFSRAAPPSASSSAGPATKRLTNRRAAGRRSIASPIRRCVESLRRSARPRSVVALDRVHENALAQSVLADSKLGDPEPVQSRHHDRRAGNNEIGAARLEARKRRPLPDGQSAQAVQESLDRGAAQDVPLHPVGIVADETEVERRQGGHGPGGSDQVGHPRRANRVRKLAVETAPHLVVELAIARALDDAGERESLGQRYHAQPQTDHRTDRVALGQHVLGAAAADVEGQHGTGQGAEPVTYAAECEAGLDLAAHHVDTAAGRRLDRRREGATVRRFTNGAGGDDPDVARAQTGAALDVATDHRERSRHRCLTQSAGAGEVLPEPRDGLVLVGDTPRPGADHVGDE